MLKYLCAVLLALGVIAGTGTYYRLRLDALSSASIGARRANAGQDSLDGQYLLGVSRRAEAGCRGLKSQMAAFMRGKPARFHSPRELNLNYLSGEKALGAYARRLAKKLARHGLKVRLRESSPVMLRSKAVSGRYDLFLAPRRVILMSDIRRLGALTLEPEEMERAL